MGPEHVVDLFKTHIWLKDAGKQFTASIVLGQLATVRAFLQAISEAFLETNIDDQEEIRAKGAIKAVKIMFWNMGGMGKSGVHSPIIIDTRTPNNVFLKFREDLQWGFQQYRQEKYGERLLCWATVAFESDITGIKSKDKGKRRYHDTLRSEPGSKRSRTVRDYSAPQGWSGHC
jgi:hypothetical protein